MCKLREQIETDEVLLLFFLFLYDKKFLSFQMNDDFTIKATRVDARTNVTDDVDIVFVDSTDGGCIALVSKIILL